MLGPIWCEPVLSLVSGDELPTQSVGLAARPNTRPVWHRGDELTSFRFLHAADIHLDSPLHGLSRYEGLPVNEIRSATRAAFDNLVQFAIDQAVDFVVIAGDLFDGDWRDMATGLYFAKAMGRLDQAGIPAFVLAGNHDAASVVSRTVPWPANVHLFGSRRPEPHRLVHLAVAIHGQSFSTPAVTENLVLAYPPAEPHFFNIGMLHTALAGRQGHADYAPCSVEDLRSRGYDYWALGHVHEFEVVSVEPYVVFPGNVQGRTIRETGAKGAVLVDVADGEVALVERVELDVIRWVRLDVNCAGACMDDAEDLLRSALVFVTPRRRGARGRRHDARLPPEEGDGRHAAWCRRRRDRRGAARRDATRPDP
ncbi:MAG: metallophosphoesterase family protein [Sphingopyxis sp.]